MATRNRTTLFRKYRDALRHVHSSAVASSSGSGDSRGGPVIELVNAPFFNIQSAGQRGYNALSTSDPDAHTPQTAVVVGLPPAWVDVSEMVAVDMQNARTKMNKLIKAHAQALMPTFDDSKGHDQNIELLTKEVTQLLKKSDKNLQKLSQGQGSNEDAKLRKNVQRFLASDLQSLSMEFRKQQKLYLQKLRQQQDHGSSEIDIGLRLNGHWSKGREDETFDPGFSDLQMARLKKSEGMTDEREKELQQIMESANDLAQIMKDLSVLVIDQGTIVDRIDHNIQNVASSVEQGVKQLEKAERTQKKGGMVLCVTILIGLCLFMIFVLIVKKLIL